ncbi:MAG: DNA-binding response regulator [Pseudomonadota bacterium]|jgi:DNA-binding response OmpR family regulator
MEKNLRIGIVEDNDDLRNSLAEVLGSLGHLVTAFSCAEDTDDSTVAETLDLLLLDLNLPGEDGLSLAARLKRVQPRLRVVMMTTRTAVDERVRGYEMGADLYLPKPVSERELLAAVGALARQIQNDTVEDARDRSALLQLNIQTLQLSSHSATVSINAVEGALLAALARAPGQRLQSWQLLQATGEDTSEAALGNLPVRMTRLRGKLIQAGYPSDSLKALRNSGYQLCVNLELV